MKGKILLRFIVTIIILALCTLTVWLVWFKPSNELETFERLTLLQNQSQKSFETTLAEISNNDILLYDENNEANKFAFEPNYLNDTVNELSRDIKFCRAHMFGEFDGSSNNDAYYNILSGNDSLLVVLNRTNGLSSMYNNVDQAFDYYYSYSQLAKKVPSKKVKELKKLTSKLDNNYTKFEKIVSEIDALSLQIDSLSKITIIAEVAASYKNLLVQFIDIIESYNNLTLNLKRFVNQYVFKNNIVYDNKTVVFDVIINSVKQFTNQELNPDDITQNDIYDDPGKKINKINNANFLLYSCDALLVNYIYVQNFGTSDEKKIFNGYPTLGNRLFITPDIIEAYATISEDYNQAISGDNSIYKLDRDQKAEVANAESAASSSLAAQYNETYLNQIQKILKFFYNV